MLGDQTAQAYSTRGEVCQEVLDIIDVSAPVKLLQHGILESGQFLFEFASTGGGGHRLQIQQNSCSCTSLCDRPPD